MTDSGLRMLYQRIADLDADMEEFPPDGVTERDAVRFARVLERCTAPGRPAEECNDLPTASPEESDGIVAASSLIQRLASAVPHVVTGPLDLSAQQWIAVDRRPHLPPRIAIPDAAHFAPPRREDPARPTTKPFWVGLFTSTAAWGSHSMWRVYLEVNRGSTLFPLPWRVWRLDIDQPVRVREITSAVDWVAFVCAYGERVGYLVYPNWVEVARHWDAVHMSAHAVAATQGLWLQAGRGEIVAATFWDVESTLWLRWPFRRVHLVEHVT